MSPTGYSGHGLVRVQPFSLLPSRTLSPRCVSVVVQSKMPELGGLALYIGNGSQQQLVETRLKNVTHQKGWVMWSWQSLIAGGNVMQRRDTDRITYRHTGRIGVDSPVSMEAM